MAALPLAVVQQHALLAQAQLGRPAVSAGGTSIQQQMRTADARKLANKRRKAQEKAVTEKVC